MSGGAWENTMSNYNGMVGSSGFNFEALSLIMPKYVTRYYTSNQELYEGYGVDYDLNVYGDSIYETSVNPYKYNGSSWDGDAAGSWYSDHSYFPHLPSASWFNRGSYWGDLNS